MFAALALAFIAIPIVEIALLLRVGEAIGGWLTVGLVIAMAMLGAALARREGTAALGRVQTAMATGQQVGASMVEGALVLVAAVLMITPGFVTDGVGFLLLVPPVRRAIAVRLRGVVAARVQIRGPGFAPPPGGPRSGGPRAEERDPPPPGVIDV